MLVGTTAMTRQPLRIVANNGSSMNSGHSASGSASLASNVATH